MTVSAPRMASRPDRIAAIARITSASVRPPLLGAGAAVVTAGVGGGDVVGVDAIADGARVEHHAEHIGPAAGLADAGAEHRGLARRYVDLQAEGSSCDRPAVSLSSPRHETSRLGPNGIAT